VFALRGISLTKLESRPIPGRPWESLFYVALAAARDEVHCTRALAHLASRPPERLLLSVRRIRNSTSISR
jgi:prephenate dehydratase